MITREIVKLFRNDAEKELEKLSEKYGITIKCGNISFTETDFTMKVNVAVKTVGDKSFEQAEFEKYCKFFGFENSDYKKEFSDARGKKYKIIGFKKSARKNPVIVEDMNGKKFVMSETTVNYYMKRV